MSQASYLLYDRLCDLWPLVSSPEDYAFEAQFWKKALRDKLGPGKRHILELGVGGGDNLSHLTGDFNATAVDISEKMLAHSRRRNPEVEHIVGDMRTVRLGRKFDAVIIHDAIGYMLTETDLQSTLITAASHLDSGGVFITAPEWLSDYPAKPTVWHCNRSLNGIDLTFIQYERDPDPADTTLECLMLYIIRQNGKVEVLHETHLIGIFPKRIWENCLRRAGFRFEWIPYPIYDDGREGLMIVAVLE
mgnify:CR=1 FL=1